MRGIHSMPRALAVGLTIVAISVVIVFAAATRPARSGHAIEFFLGKTEGNS